jgi:hypothetical protein
LLDKSSPGGHDVISSWTELGNGVPQPDDFFQVNCGTLSPRAEYAASESSCFRRVSSFLALATHQLAAFR